MSVGTFLARQRETGTAYREIPPAPDLADVVACLWARVVSLDAAPESVVVVPDGCADIMTVDHHAPLFVGPDTQAHGFALPSGIVITGLRLRPGALRGVAGCRVDEVTNTSVPLRDVDRAATALAAVVDRVETIEQRFAALEQWVRTRMRMRAHDRAVIHACRTLARRGAADMDHVAASVGWSVSTLRREFVAPAATGRR
jgi:hypothetical protein